MTGWLPPVNVAYSPSYLKWQLGEGHPTNPRRATLACELLIKILPSRQYRQVDGRCFDEGVLERALCRVHDPNYVDRVLTDGDLNGEADADANPSDLADAALSMFAGTYRLVRGLVEEDFKPYVSFNPQGAKHHAMWDRAAGFCAFNDMAWAADYLVDLGRTVGYLDWDAHHGDGVELVCRGLDAVTTYSIHQAGIFPMTGRGSYPDQGVYNAPLESGAGDRELVRYVDHALDVFADQGVDVLLLAAGADGLRDDPLTGLEYTLEGLCMAAQRVGAWCAMRRVPIVVGGAGGYLPLDQTPMAWAGVVATLQREFVQRWSA